MHSCIHSIAVSLFAGAKQAPSLAHHKRVCSLLPLHFSSLPSSLSYSPSSLHLLPIILFSVSSLSFLSSKNPCHSTPLICISSQTQLWEPEDICTSAVVVDISSTTINLIAIRRGLERPSLLRFQKTRRNTAVSINKPDI